MPLRLHQECVGLWLLIAMVPFALVSSAEPIEMEPVKLSKKRVGFELSSSGTRFVPWGHNYASVDILSRLASDPARVERELAEMKAVGSNVARVHPEMHRILIGPDQVNTDASQQLRLLLEIAQRTGVRLQITGLACYQIKDRMQWYDSLSDQERWDVQAFFWETVAATCSDSPAVFAYDLVNEPVASGQPSDGWYSGRMGDVEFCQRLTLRAGSRSGDAIFREWTHKMVDAIRKHDTKHLITLGMLPFPSAYQAAVEPLDFVSPHLYPQANKVGEELGLLKKFNWGKPVVIGETFPLSCSASEEESFLLQSRGLAQGWLGHWPDKSRSELAEQKLDGKTTIEDAVWLSWVELFQKLGPQMTGLEADERDDK